MTQDRTAPPFGTGEAAKINHQQGRSLPPKKPSVQRSRRSERHLAARQAYYDGRNCCGSVERHEAFNRRNELIGVYGDRDQALAAVRQALRGAP
jgi:hypothetical protein